MTPRELLDNYASQGAGQYDDRLDEAAPKAFAALRAVLDRHPERKFSTWSACDGCTDGDHLVTWPCPTVDAITTALGAT